MEEITPIAEWSDRSLQQAMLALQLACSKGHQSLPAKKRQWYCFLFKVLKVETDLRGLPAPPRESHVGDLHPPDLAL